MMTEEMSVRVSTIRVRFFRYQPETPLVSSLGRQSRRLMCLIEVVTEDGLVGVGESWVNFPSWAASDRYAAIHCGLSPLLIGHDVSDVMGTHQRLVAAVQRIGRQSGNPGPLAQAISGIDLALWDLAGQRSRQPVFRLLGGGNPRVPLYASALGPTVDDQIVQHHQGLGFKAFKLKVGFELTHDVSQLQRLRVLVGDRATVMVDANQAWQPAEALEAIRALAPMGLRWVEEPVAADDCDGMARVAQSSSVPIAVGENLYGRQTFAHWATRKAFEVAQPDVTKGGGLSEAWVVAHMMRAWNIPYAPHFLGGAIGLIASCHLFAAVPGGLWVEWDTNPNPLRDSILDPHIEIKDGHVYLPERPGWGFRIREEQLAPYEVSWEEALRG